MEESLSIQKKKSTDETPSRLFKIPEYTSMEINGFSSGMDGGMDGGGSLVNSRTISETDSLSLESRGLDY